MTNLLLRLWEDSVLTLKNNKLHGLELLVNSINVMLLTDKNNQMLKSKTDQPMLTLEKLEKNSKWKKKLLKKSHKFMTTEPPKKKPKKLKLIKLRWIKLKINWAKSEKHLILRKTMKKKLKDMKEKELNNFQNKLKRLLKKKDVSEKLYKLKPKNKNLKLIKK